jgi:hypothetical protein
MQDVNGIVIFMSSLGDYFCLGLFFLNHPACPKNEGKQSGQHTIASCFIEVREREVHSPG